MPSSAARGVKASLISPKPVPASTPIVVRTAISRLSDEEYQVLQEFRTAFPTLELETMRRVANAFMLFRSLYVAQKKAENPYGNQAEFSQEAGKLWRNNYTDSQKAPFSDWALRIRSLWKKMYPHGFPESAIPKKKKRSTKSSSCKSKATIAPPRSLPSVSPSSFVNFQHLPSPPISDSADFEQDDIVYNHSTKGASKEELSGDDDDDDDDDPEYLPGKFNSKRRSPSHKPSSQKHSMPQLLTPVSMTQELSPTNTSRSPSLTPTFFDSASCSPPSPMVFDVSLLELNDNNSSTFTEPLTIPSAAPPPSEIYNPYTPSDCFQQIAFGYSFEEHSNNTIMDWNENDIMSYIDPAGSHPAMSLNLSYAPDAQATATFTDEFSNLLYFDNGFPIY